MYLVCELGSLKTRTALQDRGRIRLVKIPSILWWRMGGDATGNCSFTHQNLPSVPLKIQDIPEKFGVGKLRIVLNLGGL